MSVKTIRIDNGTWRVADDFALASRGAVQLAARPGSKTVTLSLPRPESIYDKAVEKLTGGDQRYISNINGMYPNDDGLIMLNGDKCMSWTGQHGGMTIYDLCPACSSCDTYAELIRKFEQCKIALNMLKDVNIYDNGALEARAAFLEGARAELPQSCSTAEKKTLAPLFSSELLKQYTTMVHMWNYIVTTMGTSNEVVVSQDAPSGVSVRTSYSVPNCSAVDDMTATIDIQPVSMASGSQALSLFVAKHEVSFLPSGSTPSGFPDDADVSGAGLAKRVSVNFGTVSTTGTYVLTATFLPFVHATRMAGDDQHYVISVNDSPTYADYVRSVGYQTVPVDGRCVWRVTITWSMHDGKNKSMSRTYEIKTSAPRNIDQPSGGA